MSDYGCESWRIYNSVLTQMIQQAQKQLQELRYTKVTCDSPNQVENTLYSDLYRKQIQDVNWARKKEQTDVGEKIKHLEATWFGLITKNYEIELACAEIERQLASLNE